jgi:hypothetical protein
MTRITVNLTQRADAALAEITSVQECDKTAAVTRALIDYASRQGTEVEQLVRALSDARISSIQAAFRELSWPLEFTLTAAEPTP